MISKQEKPDILSYIFNLMLSLYMQNFLGTSFFNFQFFQKLTFFTPTCIWEFFWSFSILGRNARQELVIVSCSRSKFTHLEPWRYAPKIQAMNAGLIYTTLHADA